MWQHAEESERMKRLKRWQFNIAALAFIYVVQLAVGVAEQGDRFGDGVPGRWWAISLILAIAISLVAERILFRRTKSSEKEGLCTKCGYDLLATPDRCPECGQVPETVKSLL
jgi:hypothetical protein